MADPDQCALAPDGGLLDASAITFYNDVDDDTPLPNPMTTSTPLHPFFQGPGNVVGGSRRSARVSRPSAHITDPDNVEAPAVPRKRPATRWAKVTDDDDGSEPHNESDNAEVSLGDDNDVVMGDASPEGGDITTEGEDGGGDTDVEIVEEAYRSTKAMGDADRQVCLTSVQVVQVYDR